MIIILYLLDDTLQLGFALPYDYVLNIRNANIISIISDCGIVMRESALPVIDNCDIRIIGVDDV
jgi:hypothetical protein